MPLRDQVWSFKTPGDCGATPLPCNKAEQFQDGVSLLKMTLTSNGRVSNAIQCVGYLYH